MATGLFLWSSFLESPQRPLKPTSAITLFQQVNASFQHLIPFRFFINFSLMMMMKKLIYFYFYSFGPTGSTPDHNTPTTGMHGKHLVHHFIFYFPDSGTGSIWTHLDPESSLYGAQLKTTWWAVYVTVRRSYFQILHEEVLTLATAISIHVNFLKYNGWVISWLICLLDSLQRFNPSEAEERPSTAVGCDFQHVCCFSEVWTKVTKK